jgi:hypothetical protein
MKKQMGWLDQTYRCTSKYDLRIPGNIDIFDCFLLVLHPETKGSNKWDKEDREAK